MHYNIIDENGNAIGSADGGEDSAEGVLVLSKFGINTLYRQLVWSLHLAVNCDDGTNEIVQLVGKAVEVCRDQKKRVEDRQKG